MAKAGIRRVKTTRLQFDFTEDALKDLDALKDATGASNRAELIRHSLRLYQWTFEQTRDEKATFLVEKNGRQQGIVFPYWSAAHSAKSPDAKKEEVGA